MEFQSESGEWFKVNPLADTGADVTAFPRGVCEILGKKLEEGKRVDLVSATGAKLPLYLHEVKARLGSKEFIMTVGFTTTHTFPHLLGRKDILDNFTIKFAKDDVWFLEEKDAIEQE